MDCWTNFQTGFIFKPHTLHNSPFWRVLLIRLILPNARIDTSVDVVVSGRKLFEHLNCTLTTAVDHEQISSLQEMGETFAYYFRYGILLKRALMPIAKAFGNLKKIACSLLLYTQKGDNHTQKYVTLHKCRTLMLPTSIATITRQNTLLCTNARHWCYRLHFTNSFWLLLKGFKRWFDNFQQRISCGTHRLRQSSLRPNGCGCRWIAAQWGWITIVIVGCGPAERTLVCMNVCYRASN